MAFKKGFSGNPEGRPSGAKDKTNKEIREAYQELVEGNLSNIKKWLDEIAEKDPAKALDFMLKLSEYIVPKLKAVELTSNINDNRPMIVFRDVSGMTREEIANLKD